MSARANNKPLGNTAVVIGVLATVWETPTVYVPAPPVPVPYPVIYVLSATPEPDTRCPDAIVPLVTDETVMTVVAIEA